MVRLLFAVEIAQYLLGKCTPIYVGIYLFELLLLGLDFILKLLALFPAFFLFFLAFILLPFIQFFLAFILFFLVFILLFLAFILLLLAFFLLFLELILQFLPLYRSRFREFSFQQLQYVLVFLDFFLQVSFIFHHLGFMYGSHLHQLRQELRSLLLLLLMQSYQRLLELASVVSFFLKVSLEFLQCFLVCFLQLLNLV